MEIAIVLSCRKRSRGRTLAYFSINDAKLPVQLLLHQHTLKVNIQYKIKL